MPGAGGGAVERPEGAGSDVAADTRAHVVDALAVLGDGVGPTEVAATIDRPADEVLATLVDLEADGVVTGLPSSRVALSASVRSDRLRTLGAVRLAVLHRRAARAAHAAGHPPDRVARLVERAHPFPADWAIAAQRHAARAARAARRPREAVGRLEWCVATAPPEPLRSRVQVELARAEIEAGRDAGVERLRWLAGTVPGRSLRVEIAETLYAAGRFGDALAVFDEVAASPDAPRAPGGTDAELPLDESGARAVVGGLISALVDGRSVDDRMPRFAELVRATERLPGAQRRTEPARHVIAAAAGVESLGLTGPPGESVEERLRAVLTDGVVASRCLTEALPSMLALLGEADTAMRLVDERLATATDAGSVVEYASLRAIRSFCLLALGRLRAAIADAEDVVRLAAATPSVSDAALGPARFVLVSAHLARADADSARAALAGPGVPGLMAGWSVLARAALDLADGRPEAALAAARRAGEILGRNDDDAALGGWRTLAAECLIQLGRIDEAITFLDAEVRIAAARGFVENAANARRVAARLGHGGDDPVSAHRAALAAVHPGVSPLGRAATRIEYGAALRRAGDRGGAREQLRAGLAIARECGASALEAFAEGELAAAGARAIDRPQVGVDALTPAEQRIAELAARPTMNREIARQLFLSVKTVETHLSSVYRKLGVRDRGRLAEVLVAATES